MTSYNLTFYAAFPDGIFSPEESYARTLDLVSRLGKLSPLLAQISPMGMAGSYKRMEKEPLIANVTAEHWETQLRLSKVYASETAISMRLWNRHRKKKEHIKIHCLFNCSNEKLHNECAIGGIGLPYTSSDIMDGITHAFIESFDCYRTQYIVSKSGEVHIQARFYQLWTKEGASYDTPEQYDIWHKPPPAPPVSEPWHGGTRYTWPEHEPHKFLGL